MIVPDAVDTPLGDALRRAGLDSLEGAFAFQSGQDLDKPGLQHRARCRVLLQVEGAAACQLYLKRYESEPLAVRLRRWRTYGPGGGPAAVEAANIDRVRALGVDTMKVVALGRQGGLLGTRRSYIVVTAVPGEALSRVDGGRIGAKTDFARRLTEGLAVLARTLHAGGLVHRDFYASHVFLSEEASGPRLALIDLARVFRPRLRRQRWIVKDLAQLRFSMPEDWRNHWWRDFLGWYAPGAGAEWYRRLHRAVEAKVAVIRRHEERRFERQWKLEHGGSKG